MNKLYTESEIEELRKDKARIDWLADVNNPNGSSTTANLYY